MKADMSCDIKKTNSEKSWPYDEYYIGERDNEKRKNAKMGQNFWSGAESLESYKGPLLRDTMHGLGVYRWKHRGPDDIFVTYEGHFFNNRMHGYGDMSYPDGRVFSGLYHTNVRWGPGVESYPFLHENVGFWRGNQLIRLVWQPVTSSITPDFGTAPNGINFIIPHRVLVTSVIKTIGEVNSAIELLKQSGLDPVAATEKWTKLYPKHCTDMESPFCHREIFEQAYYKDKIYTLEEITQLPELADLEATISNQESSESIPDLGTFYAWNNNKMIIHMMNHCYKHEMQRQNFGIELMGILNGPREFFKPAACHELDCRTLLMASYLGRTTNVARLINENNVNPNISDMQGNSALMYAAAGDQVDTIHFLIEAGAVVNRYNDACCTPLGVALMRLACTYNDIPPNAMVQALLPRELPPTVPQRDQVSDWILMRDLRLTVPTPVQRVSSKTITTKGIAADSSAKRTKSSNSVKDLVEKKPEITPQKPIDIVHHQSDESLSEDNRLYSNILHEYAIKVNDIFLLPNPVNIPYIFEVCDMGRMIDATDEDKKLSDKATKRTVSKVMKDTTRPSKDMMWKTSEKEVTSVDSVEKIKNETLTRTMLTILQLLSDGADPRLVRFPQPALYMATVCGSSDLILHLVNYGADVNEVYPEALGYTALEMVISQPFTLKNLELIRPLLESGAKADRRLPYTNQNQEPNVPPISGPTLLHAVLARKTGNEIEDDIRQQVVELLLRYRCDALALFKGRSAVDIAMSKGIELFDLFIKSSRVNLNGIINESNQTILVKMFWMSFCKTIPVAERLLTITNLLLYGADPLIECHNREETFENLFVFAKKEMENITFKPVTSNNPGGKVDPKAKKPEKPKRDEKLTTKSSGKVAAEEISDYNQTFDLVIECARLLHIRWLQAKLMKDLINTVDKFKHRHWNMILKEINNKRCTGLWLTAIRCLEIWDILKSTKRRKYNDNKILRHVLCIVHFYFRNNKNIPRSGHIPLTAKCKEIIESEVNYVLREHKMATMLSHDMMAWKRPYVTPELTLKDIKKFNVCFECAMPLGDQKIICSLCQLVSFCSIECVHININRVHCHPCNDYLQKKYFPSKNDITDNGI